MGLKFINCFCVFWWNSENLAYWPKIQQGLTQWTLLANRQKLVHCKIFTNGFHSTVDVPHVFWHTSDWSVVTCYNLVTTERYIPSQTSCTWQKFLYTYTFSSVVHVKTGLSTQQNHSDSASAVRSMRFHVAQTFRVTQTICVEAIKMIPYLITELFCRASWRYSPSLTPQIKNSVCHKVLSNPHRK